MPELPEVESVRRQVIDLVRGRTVRAVSRDPYQTDRIFAIDDAAGRRIDTVVRRGKYLLFGLTSPNGEHDKELIVHLGMTGVLNFAPNGKHLRVAFTLDNGAVLAFHDPRRFGRVCVVAPGAYDTIPTLATLGPEPLEDGWSSRQFASALKRSKTPVKAALLNQRVVAGVGNIYADEALWSARIHPASRRVGAARAVVLHREIRRILTEAVEREGTTFRNYQLVNGASGRYLTSLNVYGRNGEACRRCGTLLRRTVIAQRGTTFCPRCQHI